MNTRIDNTPAGEIMSIVPMRVISQDGSANIPYDVAIIVIEECLFSACGKDLGKYLVTAKVGTFSVILGRYQKWEQALQEIEEMMNCTMPTYQLKTYEQD